MRLSRLLVLLLLAIIVVVGGWAMYREFFSRKTFSLNQKALEEVVVPPLERFELELRTVSKKIH